MGKGPYNTDAYKVGHWKIGYEKNNVLNMQCHVQARSKDPDTHYLYLGTQMAIYDLFADGPPTKEEIEIDKKLYGKMILGEKNPFNQEGWEILNDFGYYPLEIKSVEEGKVYPANYPLMTIKIDPEITANDRKKLSWLVPYFEPRILQNIWYPTKVTTKSFECKKVIWEHLEKTGDPEIEIFYKLHDFGYRGASSEETAGKGGLAHLVNFKGTDTNIANIFAVKYYGKKDRHNLCELEIKKLIIEGKEELYGTSIRAIEHNNVIQFGKEKEIEAYRQAIQEAEYGPISIVIDSYNTEKAVKEYICSELKNDILNAKYPVIIRTDSGKHDVIVPKVMKWLDNVFGTYKNDKGYKELNNVR